MKVSSALSKSGWSSLLLVFAVQIVQAWFQGLQQASCRRNWSAFKYQAAVQAGQGGAGGGAVVGKELAVAQIVIQLPVFHRRAEKPVGPQHGVGNAGLGVDTLPGDAVLIGIEVGVLGQENRCQFEGRAAAPVLAGELGQFSCSRR